MKFLSVLAFLACHALATAQAGDTPASHPLKHSDVVFMGSSDPAVYKAYGATVVDWGGHAGADTETAREEFGARVLAAQRLGMEYNAGIGMLTEFAGMIRSQPNYERAICRDLEGKPIMVPWLWDQKVDGKTGENYWFCSNSELYQRYLRDLTARAMAGRPDGFHIDDYSGTGPTLGQGGCFCESCMAGFREYLRTRLAAEKLRALGIDSLDGFDYGKWLLARQVTNNAEFLKRRYALPLYAEFETFEMRSAGDTVRHLQEYAAQRRGKALVRSVNGAPPSQQAFVVRPWVDHYSCEVGMGAPGAEWDVVPTNGLTPSAAFVYKCAAMADRNLACTASGPSYAYVNDRNAVNLCRYWIAESYAFGQCFMTPSVHQWCYTKEKGTHWYHAKPEDFADLYQFVRKNAVLFDDYEAVAQVGVIFNNAAWRKWKKEPQAAAEALLAANVPFALVAAGDDLLDLRLDPAKLAGFECILASGDPMPDASQQQVWEQSPVQKRVIGKNAAEILDGITPWLAVENAQGIWALPRRIPGHASAPLVVHLLNRNYDFATDKVVPQPNVVLRLRSGLLGGQAPKTCAMFTPESGPANLTVARDADGLVVKIPELKLWTILRLE